jgi:peptidyl-prolyl cis-trans isomerase D
VDLGDVSADDLGAAAETVFSAEVGDVTAPAASDFGPALFRVNAVLPAQFTSFEDAQPDLRDALALDRARRVIDAQAQGFDDELAAGATLEELAESSDLALATMGWTGANAEDAAGYENFRELAASVAEGDYPTVVQLGDGGIFALRLDEVTPATPRDFNEVRDEVQAGWEQNARITALVELAQSQADTLTAGGDFATLALDATSEDGLTRNAYGEDMPAELLDAVFDLDAGQAIAIASGDGAIIVKLDDVIAADREDETAQMLRGFYGDQAANDVSEDLFRALAADIQTRAGVEINQAAINAVHANFQ